MESEVFKSPAETAKAAANEVAELLRENPIAILGVSTGHAFVPFYKELVRCHKEEGVSMHKFRTFQTTEYMGLPGTHPMSCRYFLVENFFEHVPAPRRYQKRLPGLPINIDASISKFEQRIKSVDGIDLLILGLGRKGQLGFNEKGSSHTSRTRPVKLSEDIREQYEKDFPRGAIPRRGLTMGIGTMLEARRIIVLVTEEDRADALEKMLTAKITPTVPATALRGHPNVKIYVDKKVAAKTPIAAR